MSAPETGPQPQDGPVHKKGRGRARLHEHGEDVEPDHPLAKFERVWTDGAGNSGTERIVGQ